MKYLRIPLVVVLSIAVAGLMGQGYSSATSQGQSTALERGYRTGYSDGYNAGFKDVADNTARDYQTKEEYQRADRSFNDVWGPIEDYRDGYQQGYERGYGAGYDRQQFDSTLPTGLRRRQQSATVSDTNPPNNGAPASTTNSAPANTTSGAPAITTNGAPPSTTPDNTMGTPPPVVSLSFPKNTILAMELLTPISTDISQRGDRFQARVTEPTEYAGSIVEGRVSQVKRPGKVKGVAELQLSFDEIRSADNRFAAGLHAELLEITAMRSDGAAEVDPEGGVKGRDSTKDDAAKVGAASGIGAIIGAIAGGGKGAVIGAVIGGGAGTAGVMTQRGKEIRLDRGQLIKIRTTADTSVQ